VRPVLVQHCFDCHSARAAEKGGLRLDGPSALAGDEGAGRLARAVRQHNSDTKIPPTAKLSDQQLEDLARWVRLGAPWPAEAAAKGFDLWQRRDSHWAWQPVKPHASPEVKKSPWVKDPIDAFVLAKLEAAGLTPAPRADRQTLIRRLSFVL